jgi:hypothetical protein
MYVVSLIADFFLCRHVTQVTLFVCWSFGKYTYNCMQALVNRVMNLQVPYKVENLTS